MSTATSTNARQLRRRIKRLERVIAEVEWERDRYRRRAKVLQVLTWEPERAAAELQRRLAEGERLRKRVRELEAAVDGAYSKYDSLFAAVTRDNFKCGQCKQPRKHAEMQPDPEQPAGVSAECRTCHVGERNRYARVLRVEMGEG
jgi:chromosome segregation ATPase